MEKAKGGLLLNHEADASFVIKWPRSPDDGIIKVQRMPRSAHVALFLISFSSPVFICAQENPQKSPTLKQKTLVIAPETKSDATVAIPPITSVTVTINLKSDKQTPNADEVDLTKWLSREAALNGLQSTELEPWHIVVTYDQFDEDGDNVHSGVYEEYWAGVKKYKRTYKSDNLNQTDYATDKGLYRLGDQQWPDRAQLQVRSEVVDPFSYAATLAGFRGRNVERTFSGYELRCVLFEKDSVISNPTQYCFEPDGSVLRYSKGFGWFQTVYNQIVPFQGRSLAQEIEVTDGGKPYLRLHVETIEPISQLDDANFVPPPNAIGPLGDRVSGVHPVPIKTTFPQWPTALRSQHFTVTMEIVIGKDGHVVSAHGVSGPAEGYKVCEDSVKKWIFAPYLVLGNPVEVETKVQCSNN